MNDMKYKIIVGSYSSATIRAVFLGSTHLGPSLLKDLTAKEYSTVSGYEVHQQLPPFFLHHLIYYALITVQAQLLPPPPGHLPTTARSKCTPSN